MKAEDYLDLPGTIINRIELEMTDNLRKKYVDFERGKSAAALRGGRRREGYKRG